MTDIKDLERCISHGQMPIEALLWHCVNWMSWISREQFDINERTTGRGKRKRDKSSLLVSLVLSVFLRYLSLGSHFSHFAYTGDVVSHFIIAVQNLELTQKEEKHKEKEKRDEGEAGVRRALGATIAVSCFFGKRIAESPPWAWWIIVVEWTYSYSFPIHPSSFFVYQEFLILESVVLFTNTSVSYCHFLEFTQPCDYYNTITSSRTKGIRHTLPHYNFLPLFF